MKIAITIWGTKISPVFDSARTLLVVEVQGANVIERRHEPFEGHLLNRSLMLIRALDVRVLLCGALCEAPARILEANGVEVIPFLSGDVEKVIESYVLGGDLARFSLPGCRGCICRWNH